MTVGGHRKRGGGGLALHTFAHGPSTPLSGGGRLEGVAEADTDASHSTGILGKAKRKEGRPRASTKDSDTSTATARGQQSRSHSEGMIPQIMYMNQAESHSLPTVPDSPAVTRAVPQFSGPLSPHSTVHPPLECSSNDIPVTTTTETSTESDERGDYTQGTDGGNVDKKEILIRTTEVNPGDP